MVLSMLATPFIILYSNAIVRKLVASDWLQQSLQMTSIARKTINTAQHVIICGYGRCGQNLARILEREGIPYMALDLDPDRVRQAAAAGDSVVFGDAARLQALMAAGLARASAVVVTYLDVPGALKVLANTRAHAPQVPVIVRTQDDRDLEKLQAAGATEVVPEAIEGSLMLASHALALVGVPMRRVIRVVQDQRDARYDLLRGYFHGADDDNADEIDHERFNSFTLTRGCAAPSAAIDRAGCCRRWACAWRACAAATASASSWSDDTVLADGDTLVLSGKPARAGAGGRQAAEGLSGRALGAPVQISSPARDCAFLLPGAAGGAPLRTGRGAGTPAFRHWAAMHWAMAMKLRSAAWRLGRLHHHRRGCGHHRGRGRAAPAPRPPGRRLLGGLARRWRAGLAGVGRGRRQFDLCCAAVRRAPRAAPRLARALLRATSGRGATLAGVTQPAGAGRRRRVVAGGCERRSAGDRHAAVLERRTNPRRPTSSTTAVPARPRSNGHCRSSMRGACEVGHERRPRASSSARRRARRARRDRRRGATAGVGRRRGTGLRPSAGRWRAAHWQRRAATGDSALAARPAAHLARRSPCRTWPRHGFRCCRLRTAPTCRAVAPLR